MLVKYIREDSKLEGTKGKPFGVVVAIAPEVVGYSICNPNDRWDKKRGLDIAIGRAIKHGKMDLFNLNYQKKFMK